MSQVYFEFVSISKNKFWRFYCGFQSLIGCDKHLLKMDGFFIYFILSSEFNAYQIVNKIDFFSVV